MATENPATSTTYKTATNHRDLWIDAARGAAALSVTLFHFNCHNFHEGFWQSFWKLGYLGVPAFFVLSGWCITGSWLRSGGWKDFSLRRICRIFPAYYASLLVTLFVVLATKILTGVNDMSTLPATPEPLFATLIIMTDPATNVPAINWVYWTLTFELAFYCILSVILFLSPSTKRVLWLAGLHTLFCFSAIALPLPLTGPFFFVRLWPLFGLEAALALFKHHPKVSIVMLVSCFLSMYGFEAISRDYIVIAVLTSAGLFLSHHVPFPFFLKPLRSVGLFSYSLYLIHVPIGVYFLTRILPHSDTQTVLICRQAAIMAFTLCFAWCFYRLFEVPFFYPALQSRFFSQPNKSTGKPE